MMQQFLIILKIKIISQLKLNALKGKKAIVYKIAIAGILFALILGFLYFASIGYGLSQFQLREKIPAFSFLLSSLIAFFTGMMSSRDTFFGKSDNETLMSFPIKTSVIVASKFFSIYFFSSIAPFVIMLPMGLVYFFTGTTSLLFLLKLFLGILTVALIPTIIASILNVIVLEIASRVKYAGAFSSIAFIGIMVIFLCGPMLLNQSAGSGFEIQEILKSILNQSIKFYPIIQLYNVGITTERIGIFLIYLAVSLLVTLIFILGMSHIYKRLNTSMVSFNNKKKYGLTTLKVSGIVKALYKKELKRLFSSTVYLTMTLGMIFMVVFALSFFFGGTAAVTKMIGEPAIDKVVTGLNLQPFIPYLLAMLVGFSCTSCVSFSLEGKNVWIIKTLPLRKEWIVRSKVLVNLTMTLPVTIISGLVIGIATNSSIFNRLILVLLPVIFGIFSAVYGVAINLKFVNYLWQTEAQVVKRSVASVLGLLGGIVLALIPAILKMQLPDWMGHSYDFMICIVLIMIIFLLYRRITRDEVF